MLALLPSPFLGGAVWAPVAAVLNEQGWQATAVQFHGAAPANAGAALDAYLKALPPGEEYVLVPHSNAGLYVPALTEHRNVAAVVFVDAALPPANGGEIPILPPEFLEIIAAKADGQRLLPVWTEWWDEADVSSLFPDRSTRAVVEQQQRRLPLSYVEDVVNVRANWADRPCAYIAFGEGYAAETAAARQLGWPVRVLDGEHLAMLAQPQAVGGAIAALLQKGAELTPD
jgi:hypothetical protein